MVARCAWLGCLNLVCSRDNCLLGGIYSSVSAHHLLNRKKKFLYVYLPALILFSFNKSRQRKFSRVPHKSVATTTLPPSQIPHVTVIRPIKGTEPYLYECLAASLRQEYPRDKLTVYFCVSSVHDLSYAITAKVLDDFPDADAKLFVEPEYSDRELGPNPKIRNISKAYREAKGDIVWIVDCNVWLGKGVCGRMVDRLCGFDPKVNGGRKYKFVHHLPIVVDVDEYESVMNDGRKYSHIESSVPTKKFGSSMSSVFSMGGGRLEELFLASSHAKMYSAINTVLIAPCIVGKSSMFRRSHLNYLTDSKVKPQRLPRQPGVDYFSDNICEDHLIGDRLWKQKVREEAEDGEVWGKHNLAFGDMAIQPTCGMGVRFYIDRRVRWLRVRKFTVLLATLVEPGTESFLCSLYLAFGVTTVLPLYFPQFYPYLGSWSCFFAVWAVSILLWMTMDWTVHLRLHSAATVEVDEHTPPFARPLADGHFSRRSFREWLLAWIGREALALPIWIWAVYCGTEVTWRDRTFKVGLDAVTHEIVRRPTSAREEGRHMPQFHPSRTYGAVTDRTMEPLRRRTPNGSLVETTEMGIAGIGNDEAVALRN